MDRASKRLCVWTASVLLIFGISAAPAVAAPWAFDATGSEASVSADPPAPTPPAPAPTTPVPEFVDTVLSDENLESRWAFVTRPTIARSEPSKRARKIRKLTTRTPDRTNELVLALKSRQFANGDVWVQVRLPMRGSGRKGWVSRAALGKYRVVRTKLIINRGSFRATLYKSGKKIWETRIGVGKKGTSTPAGRFYIRNKLTVANPGGMYGPYAMGLSAYSKTLTDWPGGGIIGIHGTNQPGLIPGRVSHGCVRVKNAKIRRLNKLMGPGTPVLIK
ncbi:MAG: L,D-transpeptidase [Solirubrobacterales bacterium]